MSASRLLLSMGLKPHGDVHRPLAPALRWLSLDDGHLTDVPLPLPDLPHPGPSEHAEFTGAHRHGDVLIQCTRTAVLWLSWPDLAIVRTLTHPLLHDVHHALPLPDGGLAVAATGHDSVLRFDAEGVLVAHHWLPGDAAGFAETYGHIDDFRTLPFAATKPHAAHPNHLFRWRDRLWATCLRGTPVRPVGHDGVFPEGIGDHPHDGDPHDGRLWFTHVDGAILGWADDGEAWRVQLDAIEPEPGLPGWCRSIAITSDAVYAGVSMLRSSTHREAARQLLRGRAGRKKPTRVVAIDRRSRQRRRWFDVGNAAGGTIYAITPDGE